MDLEELIQIKIAKAESKNDHNEPIEVNEAIHHWHFDADIEGKRLPGRPWMEDCIANSIKTTLDRGPLIFPKDGNEWRKIQPGDIAVLCRSNKDCQAIAEALHKAGLKAAIARTGLLKTAEARLVLACLRFMLNKKDSLSIAEILKLASGKHIEEIVEDRLDFLDKNKNGNASWAESNFHIEKLNHLRRITLELSSAELLDVVLEELDMRRIVSSWGKMEQRLDNVDVMRKFALQYEEACNRLHSAASLGGFLLWLNDLEGAEKDTQGSGEGNDAVNVLTYHRSKGLEWGMVVCHSLEGKLRSDVFGMHIISEQESVDLDNILANRWLRFWINPYSDQSGGTALAERLATHEVSQEAKQKALQEEARLLYVGITRARDYLVFPTRKRPTLWLNRVCHAGDEKTPSLDENSGETQWEWGNILYKETWVQSFQKDIGHAEPSNESIYFLEERQGDQSHQSYLIDLTIEDFSNFKGTTGTEINLASCIPIKEDLDIYLLSKMAKAFLIADHLDYDDKIRWNMASGFLERYELSDFMDENALIQYSNNFFKQIQESFSIKKIHRKYPIRHFYQNRLFETVIDFVIETENGIVIIQNGDSNGDNKKLKNKALKLTSFLHLSKSALEIIFQKEKIKTLVHFPLNGSILAIETKENSSNLETTP